MSSGLAPGGRVAKFGGPVRSRGSSVEAFGSGRFRPEVLFGMVSLPAPPRPEALAFGFGSPPLMLMPMSFFPAAPLEPPFPPSVELDEEPVAPGFPSGEMETRAARLPCGTGTTGAGGAGFAESAISVLEASPAAETAGTSGAAAVSPSCARAATRGAEPVLICSLGFAGPAGAAAMLISAGRCSTFGRSGAGVSATAAFFVSRGLSFANDFSLISRCGRAGACAEPSCTMLGIGGRIFGASGGAAGSMSVCRGCVG